MQAAPRIQHPRNVVQRVQVPRATFCDSPEIVMPTPSVQDGRSRNLVVRILKEQEDAFLDVLPCVELA